MSAWRRWGTVELSRVPNGCAPNRNTAALAAPHGPPDPKPQALHVNLWQPRRNSENSGAQQKNCIPLRADWRCLSKVTGTLHLRVVPEVVRVSRATGATDLGRTNPRPLIRQRGIYPCSRNLSASRDWPCVIPRTFALRLSTRRDAENIPQSTVLVVRAAASCIGPQ